MGKVIFAGAGPGDPELISVKALKALRNADVVLYDALVDKRLLAETKRRCKHVDVGKRKGRKEFSQDEINSLLVFYARRYDVVVRLKGGDPNVFGRGHEEMTYVAGYGIAAEMIPGISSAIAAASAANIPLTKRGVNESFWVLTGTTSSGAISGDLEHASRSSAAIVILMGASRLAEIAAVISRNRSAAEPMAVVQCATLAEQRIVTGTAGDVAVLAAEQQIGSPAVIIIGAVVNQRDALLAAAGAYATEII